MVLCFSKAQWPRSANCRNPALSSKPTLMQLQRRLPFTRPSSSFHSRRILLLSSTSLICSVIQYSPYSPLIGHVHCEEEKKAETAKELKDEEGLLGSIKALFDPNGNTKSGKILPKSYLKNANDVVKNLKDTLKDDGTDAAKFRRTADSAKESIKLFLKDWTDQKTISSEESYVALMKAIRLLADFYSKKGPTAVLSEDIKSKLTDYLNTAEAAL